MRLWSGRKSTGEPLRCSFCNKSQRDVRKLITGPEVRICDGCVGICLEIISEDLEAARSARKGDGRLTSCMICGNVVQPEGLIPVGVLGKACQGCAEDVRDALLAWHQDHDGAAV